MASLHQKLCPHADVIDLVELGVEETLQYDPYEDKLQNAKMFPMLDKEPEVTPEWGDQYVNAEILLPRGDKMARGWVVHRKHDADGNTIGRSNQYPILDTCLYEVEFLGEEMTELSANIISKPMYAQCNVNRNKYLLLEAFIDHRKNGSALSVEDKKVVLKGFKNLRKSIAGWDICCKWKDKSTSWEKLSNLKKLDPFQVAKYAIAQGIQHEPELTGGSIMSWRKGTKLSPW